MEIKRGDIYFAVLDHGIGSEQSGYRPVLVIQNNVGNQYSPTVIVAAITSKVSKKKLPTHIPLPEGFSGLPIYSVILLEQIYTIDKARLRNLICRISDGYMAKIDSALMCSLGIRNTKEGETAYALQKSDT